MQSKTQIPCVHNEFESIFTDNDVLFGRGRAIERRPGNWAFRLYIQQYSDEYSLASRAVKSFMLSQILESLKKRGVRMFKSSEGGIWQQADDKEMKLKVSVQLDSCLPKQCKNPVHILTIIDWPCVERRRSINEWIERNQTHLSICLCKTSCDFRWDARRHSTDRFHSPK